LLLLLLLFLLILLGAYLEIIAPNYELNGRDWRPPAGQLGHKRPTSSLH